MLLTVKLAINLCKQNKVEGVCAGTRLSLEFIHDGALNDPSGVLPRAVCQATVGRTGCIHRENLNKASHLRGTQRSPLPPLRFRHLAWHSAGKLALLSVSVHLEGLPP
jgi:hypothetical protein